MLSCQSVNLVNRYRRFKALNFKCGIVVDPLKIESILEWKVQNIVIEIISFLK